MDTVTVPASVQVGHQWMTAHWSVEEVGDGGEIVIGVTLTANRVPYLRLRMDTALVRDLRVLAGFGEPSTNGSTNARMGEADDLTAVWNELAKHEGAIHSAYERIGEYDAMLRRELAQVEGVVRDRAMRTELQGEKNYLTEYCNNLDSRVASIDQRITALEQRLLDVAKRSGLSPLVSPLARSMYENYDAENDASLVSYWDMQLLDMIERIGSMLMLLAGRNDDGKTSDA